MTPNLVTGNGFKTVLKFSLPMIIGAVIQQIYNAVDCIIVGNFVGSEALAAVGSTGTVIFFLFSLNSGLANGCSVVIAQHYGAGSEKQVRVSIVSAFYYTIGCTLLISVLGYVYVRHLLILLQTPADILEQAALYLRIYVGCSFGQIIYNNVSAMIQSLGDSKTPLIFLIFCSLLNVVLDLVFVAGLGEGVRGAAVATVLSQIISGLLCTIYAARRYSVFRIRKEDLRPSADNIVRIAKIGIPMGVYSSVLSVGDMIVTAIINTYGTAVVAAFAAASRVHQFCIIPFFNFSLAFSTFTAQNYGARQYERIKNTIRQSSIFLVAVALAVSSLIVTFRYYLLSVFITSADSRLEEVMTIGGAFLKYVPWFYPFIALIWLFNYMIRGTGRTGIPILSGIVELVSKIVLPYYLGKSLGYVGVWYGFPLCWILGLIPTVIYYYSGRWYKSGPGES